MKSKKSLLIISVIVALATVLAAFSGISAFAAPTEYEVKSGDIYERAAVEVPVDYVVDKNTGEAVGSSDITEVKVTSEDEFVTYESGVKDASGKGYIYASGKIKYYYSENLDKGTGEDKYKVTVTVKDVEDPFTVIVTVVGKDRVAGDGTLKYNDKATIDSAVSDKNADDTDKEDKFFTTSGSGSSVKLSITFDRFLKTFTSKYVDETLLKYTVYYLSPRSTDFSSTSVKTGALADVTLSDEGVYRVYVLISDGEENEISVEDLDQRTDGFYASEAEDAELVVPIFEYDYVKATEDKAVSVTAKAISAKNAIGRINQRYQSVSFEVTNAAYEKYTLKYRANADSEWIDAENGVHANFTESSFTSSQVYFTPLVKGQFKVEAKVKGNAEDLETKIAESTEITVSEKIEELKLVDEKVKKFFKNNWLSVLFLGIALLCLVGIVVIALWKPSDGKKTKTAKEEEKAEETTVAADEPVEIASNEEKAGEETTETAEETTESTENAETAEETTQTEQNAEENAQATEEAVESVEVSETPAETTEASEETAQPTENGENGDNN